MRQEEQDGTIGTAKSNSVGPVGENIPLLGNYESIPTMPSNHKTQTTTPDYHEESSGQEAANITTSSSTPGEDGNQKIRRTVSRVRKPSFL